MGFGDDGKVNLDDGDDEDIHEIVASNPLDAFAEDAIWQEDQIDNFLNQNQADQNLKIARNLLATTALTRHEIAEITGVDADALKDYESDYSGSEYTDDEEEEDNADEDVNNDKGDKHNEQKEKEKEDGGGKVGVAEGVTIKASDFSKSVMLTKDDLGALKKLNGAININPKGHSKRNKTLAKLKVDNIDSDEKKQEKLAKLPAKYRVVIHPGALCKAAKELSSGEVCKLPIGTVVTVEEIDGRGARISAPNKGWLSIKASDGRLILSRCNVKSAAMDKAIHAERARQTKVLILKSITTLNDATVTRILEKSDWNLRRAIEAFYIAKYKTQEYLTKKEASSKAKGNGAAAKSAPSATSAKSSKGGKKGKTAWWKSW